MFDIILDCYTDEPSGLGAPPYLSIHSRYLAGTLNLLNREYFYITIDDIRVSNGEVRTKGSIKALNKRVINTTKNCKNTKALLKEAKHIFVIYGCFVKYNYVSCEPPLIEEVESVLANYKAKTTLFYCLGTENIPGDITNGLKMKFGQIYCGNIYNYFIDYTHPFKANYQELARIAPLSAGILEHIDRPMIMELESMNGCNHKPGCSFCIESHRNNPLCFREETDIIQETIALYSHGARYFRIGRQPNFYAYGLKHDVYSLLSGICENCPDIKMLHIDNVNPVDVVMDTNAQTTKAIIKYCTSGNIAPFGVESFDERVREKCNLNGSIEDILNATRILNSLGTLRNDQGMPQFLPGYNFIYGLSGQSPDTLEKNLEYLTLILENDWLVRRTFVRKLTSPYGTAAEKSSLFDVEYQYWCNQIEQSFSFPMLQKIYPKDILLRDARVEMVTETGTILRMFGTCAERIFVPDKYLELDTMVDVKIIGYINHRCLKGELQ